MFELLSFKVSDAFNYLKSIELFWLIFMNFFMLFTALFIMKFKKRSFRHESLLDALGIKGGRVKIHVKDRFVFFEGISERYLENRFWEKNKEIISHYFQRQIIEFEIFKIRSLFGVRLYYDCLPEKVTYNPELIQKPMDVYLGINNKGKHVTVNLMRSPSIYIDGKPGAGKSVAIKSILKGYKDSFKTDDLLEVIVCTSKMSDYYYLEEVKGIKAYLIDIFDNEKGFIYQSKKIRRFLGSLRIIQNEYNQIIRENNLKNIENIESLRRVGFEFSEKRKIFVFDEAKDYLSKDKSDTKEEALEKQKLITSVGNHIRRNARFLSTPIIVAAQVQNENDLDISLKSFHLRMASHTNEALSKLISGSNLLTDPSFRAGKFFLRTQKKDHILRVTY